MPKHMANALNTLFQRYNTYLNAFGPEEGYLKKKVETELGSRMIFLKMRCSGLNSDWGKVCFILIPNSFHIFRLLRWMFSKGSICKITSCISLVRGIEMLNFD